MFYIYPCSLLLSLNIDDCTKINGHRQITHIMRDLQVPLALSLSLSGTNHNCNTNPLQLNQIKSNHFYCHITTAQVPWWVKFLWACSRQCRKTTDNLHMDRQCKKTTNNLHMDRQCKKLHWSIYSAPDSAKKTTAIYIWTDSAKKQQQFTYGQYIFTDCTEDNVQNTHTYTQYA